MCLFISHHCRSRHAFSTNLRAHLYTGCFFGRPILHRYAKRFLLCVHVSGCVSRSVGPDSDRRDVMRLKDFFVNGKHYRVD